MTLAVNPYMAQGSVGAGAPPIHSWICVGTRYLQSRTFVSLVGNVLNTLRRQLPERVVATRWIRYRVNLSGQSNPDTDVQLSPLCDGLIHMLRRHPDRTQNQLVSGLRFWDHGLRRGYLWQQDGQLLCVQWLVTSADNATLRTLATWGGMYPPLPEGVGQVENLFAFSGSRQKGVATRFELALYEEAKRMALRELRTHIADDNGAARGWAAKTGWAEYGVITRYRLDLPGLRGLSIYLHEVAPGYPLPTRSTG